MCEANFTGDDCSEYLGTCAVTCYDSSGDVEPAVDCLGPGAEDCTVCVANSHRSLNGGCTCDDGWGEEDCSTYNGQCSSMCDGACSGPGSQDCEACITNSAPDADGFCVCDTNWGDDNCTSYLGVCDEL